MKIYEGVIETIGRGIWIANTAKAKVRLSVLEIGNEEIRDVLISDYLRNYLEPGENAKILVYKGILPLHKEIAAIQINNKKRGEKSSTIIISIIVKVILAGILLGFASFLISPIIMLLWVGYIIFQFKNYSDFTRF